MGLIEYLPDYYTGNQTMEELQDILSKKIEEVASSKGDTIDQCFISTASYLLGRYEKIYAVDTDITVSEEYRIETIKAKIAGIGTTTKQMIEDMALSYGNGEVTVIEDNENYRFIVKFINKKGIPSNINSLIAAIKEVKPAHLEFELSFLFNTWSEVSMITWGQAKEFTWNDIREGIGWPNIQNILI